MKIGRREIRKYANFQVGQIVMKNFKFLKQMPVKIVLTTIVFICLEIGLYKITSKVNIIGNYPMYSNIGKVDSKFRINAIDEKEGYLAFGPYMVLEKGKYGIKYKLFLHNLKQIESQLKAVACCDIIIDGHPELYFSAILNVNDFVKKNPQEFTYNFYIPEGKPKIQFRVNQFAGNRLSLMNLSVIYKDIRNFVFNSDNKTYLKHYFVWGTLLLLLTYLNFIFGLKNIFDKELMILCIITLLFIIYNSWLQMLTRQAKVFGWLIIIWFLKIFLKKIKYKISLPKFLLNSYFIVFIAIAVFLFTYYTFPGHPSEKLGKGWFVWCDQGCYLQIAKDFLNLKLVVENYVFGLGYPIIGTLFLKIYPADPFMIPNLILFIITILLYYKISRYYLSDNMVLLTIILLLLCTQYTEFFVIPWNNIIPTVALGFIIYVAVKANKIKIWHSVMMGLLIGWTFAARYVDIVFLIPIVIYIYLYKNKKDEYNKKYFIITVLTAFIIFLLVIYSHKYAFGSYWKTPYQLPNRTVKSEQSILAAFDLSKTFKNLYEVVLNPYQFGQLPTREVFNMPLLGYSFFFLLSIAGFIYLVFIDKNMLMKVIFFVIIAALIFYGSFFSMNAGCLKYYSLRYFTMLYPILTIVSVYGLKKILKYKNEYGEKVLSKTV
ncbi:MAG: hypothetical protein A2474_01765 [Elusimicrobia bacterium RIFOXYC2_FULL_34_12]|nr:MAG: hypothetical protein A2474_01765 [Elusimicrobia bacterium RIFOXYC2_FULL_34_12]